MSERMHSIRPKILLALAAALAITLATGTAVADTGVVAAKKKRCKRTDYCGHYVGKTGSGNPFELLVRRAGIVLVSARVAVGCNSGGSPAEFTTRTITRRYKGHPLHVSRKGKVRSAREGQASNGGVENLYLTGRFKSGRFKGTFRYLSEAPIQGCDSGKVAVNATR
jgi:hypothetical protein